MVDITKNDPVTLPNDMISVSYSATDGVYTFNDAIVVLSSQYYDMVPSDIDAEIQRRWDEWIIAINTPSEEVIDG